MGNRFPLEELAIQLRDLGATEVLVKHLASNNNSRNQIYLPGDISSISLLPVGEIEPAESSSKKKGNSGPIFRARLDFWWLNNGLLRPAPEAKLILYPQYPEMRLSGFLERCENAPSELMSYFKRGREEGRVLVLAPLPDKRIVAVIFPPEAPESEVIRLAGGEQYGVLRRFDLGGSGNDDSQTLLLSELRRIHLLGWLDPQYRRRDGAWEQCVGTNCGGVTLESHLGIVANGYAEPDFHGWEIKQHGVGSWARPVSGRITLMTPEPNGGAYVERGPRYFVETWGYVDQRGREDRLNFGGIYRAGAERNARTGLRLVLTGYDTPSGRFEADGSVMMIDADDRVAASWSFAKLMDHWKRKHAKAAFVPSIMRREPSIQYQYGSEVALAEGGRFSLLLRAFAYGSVYYDPGIKLEGSGSNARLKRRSQFRIDGRLLSSLYETYRNVDLLSAG